MGIELYFPKTVNLTSYADTGDDCALAITNALTAGKILYLEPGIYTYATSPNFAVANAIIDGNGATFKHTGLGNAFILDGGAVAGTVSNIKIRDVVVEGNANSDNAVFARAVMHSFFTNLKVTGAAVTGAALLVKFAVCSLWTNFKCTINEPCAASMPANGIVLTNRGAMEAANIDTFINPIVEGLTGTGINLDFASSCQIIGGASEGNAKGFVIGGSSLMNQIRGPGCESNSANDVEIAGYNNQIHGGNYENVVISLPGVQNAFYGSWIHNLTVDANTSKNSFSGVKFIDTVTDNGTDTSFTNCITP
jgi:hypothetical protein